jgi:DNA-binding NarL/FixJ family response regulator
VRKSPIPTGVTEVSPRFQLGNFGLTDIRLARGSNGVDLARELHARMAVRCIFVSANLDEPTRRAVEPYDPIEFMGKPIIPVVLERALAKARALIEP